MSLAFIGKLWPLVTRKRLYEEIDPKVAPVVEAMNATVAIQTIASCQGHWQLGKPPYVYFRCSVETAALLERSIRTTGHETTPHLHRHWIVEGCFDDQFELAFRLHAPAYDDDAFSISSLIRFGLWRKSVDEDLSTLTRILRELLPYFGKKLEPEICTGSDKNHPCNDKSNQEGTNRHQRFSAKGVGFVASDA